MVFSATPPRSNAPSQLLSLSSILSTTGGSSNAGSVGSSGGVAITNPVTIGTVGTALVLVGTVSPSGTAVQTGLSTSDSVAPASWINATVTDGVWSASVTPEAAGTYYIWAEQTNTTSVQAVSSSVTISSSSSGSVAFTSVPTTGIVGEAILLAGSVSPAGSAVQVGLSSSATIAPTSWTNGNVSGTTWTASLTPSAAGTYYLWVEQSDASSTQAVSGAVSVSASSGGGLSYSLISGSGNGSLTGVTLTTGPNYTVDWSTSIEHGAVDVAPNVAPSAIGSIAACKFWFDSSATGVTPGNYGNAASFNNDEITFYAYDTGYGTPTTAPAAPSTAGTYYGKYAMYDSSNNLLGVFVTSAITII